jgi:GNAT superfamily N-acetyltransferase
MRIVRVDPSTSREVLDYLQVTCLPQDVPDSYQEDDIWVVMMDNGIPAAFGACRLLYESTWYLNREGVIPPYRGRGIQAKLHAALERHAKKQGATLMVSDCTAENSASANNFIKTHYKIYNPALRWGLPNAIYWYKKLN